MASNAVVAPRGSRFISASGNLEPAWHHYLANIEGLTTDLTTTIDGQVLLDIEARISALEEIVTAAEEVLPKRNWAFFYTDKAILSTAGGGNCTTFVNHDLNTRTTLARAQDRFTGSWRSSSQASAMDDNSIAFTMFPASAYSGNGLSEAWVLGLYDELR